MISGIRFRLMAAAMVVAALTGVDAARGQQAAQAPQPPQQPIFSLLDAGKLPEPRMMHGCAVIGDRIYVMGGNLEPDFKKDRWTNDVKSAPIGPDRKVGAWRTEASLPYCLAYVGQAVQAVNNHIYIMGGDRFEKPDSPEDTSKQIREVIWTTVGPDGVLSPWKTAAPFPGNPVSCLATCASDRSLMVVGGQNSDLISDAVLYCDLAADGEPKNWVKTANLPVPLWFEGAAALDNRVYSWGGITKPEKELKGDAAFNRSIFSSALSGAGDVLEWKPDPTQMPYSLYSGAFCGFNDYLVCVSGRYQGNLPTNAIWFTRMVNGQSSGWRFLNTDLKTRIYHALGMERTRGWVYITGGVDRKGQKSADGVLLDAIQAFQLPQPTESKLVLAASGQAAGSGQAAAAGATPAPQSQQRLAQATPIAQANGMDIRGMEDALNRGRVLEKPVIAFFFAPDVPACLRAWSNILMKPEFAKLAQGSIFSIVDVSTKEGVAYSYKYSIFKVPSIVVVTPTGEMRTRIIGVYTADDLKPLGAGPAAK